jgi:hypothetical protein
VQCSSSWTKGPGVNVKILEKIFAKKIDKIAINFQMTNTNRMIVFKKKCQC